jgi:drug/metabolite transporter (DMT)-like permease
MAGNSERALGVVKDRLITILLITDGRKSSSATPMTIAQRTDLLRARDIPLRARIVVGYAIIYIVWGSTYLAIRYAIQTVPPFLMCGVRFVIAGAILIAWACWRGATWPTRAQWSAATIIGAALILASTATVGWAEQWVPSGMASLLAAMPPLWIVLMEWMGARKVRPGPAVIVGIILGLAGVALLVQPTGRHGAAASAYLWGAAALVFGSFTWAAGSLYSIHAPRPSSAPLAVGMQMMMGGVLSVIVGLAIGEGRVLDLHAVSAQSLIALGYLIAFGALVGFTAYLWLLQVSKPSRVATHAYVNPVVAVLLGWSVAHEPLTARIIVAAAIIVGSVALITTGRLSETGRAQSQEMR